MKIKTLIHAAGVAIIGGLVGLTATNYAALQELKIRGPVYAGIVLNKDLVADIIPPPLNLLEPYLELTRLMVDPSMIEKFKPVLAKHRGELDERKAFWAKQPLTPAVAESIAAAMEPTNVFWDVVNKEYLPSIARKDSNGAKQAYAKLSDIYNEHQTHIANAQRLIDQKTAQTEDDASSAELRWGAIAGGVTIMMFLLAMASAAGLVIYVVRPIEALGKSMFELAGGDCEAKVVGLGRDDEVGSMATAVEVFRADAIERRRLEQEQAASLAREQLRQKHLEEQVEAFRSEISGVIRLLGEQAQNVRGVATNLVTVAGTTTQEAKAAAQATTGAADNAQAVAAATEQLGASIREIASQAHRTSDIVNQTTDAARRTNSDVEGLAEAAQRIGSIVELIRNVAEQTNLLALNATIEAARAGEAGKGFAVVAAEVKSLASQTAKATDEISSQIQAVQASTGSTVESIRAISTRIDEINGLTGGIAAAVEQQEAATREIAQNVSTAADRSREAASNVSTVLGGADQTVAGAASMTSATDELGKASARINASFEKFVSAVSSDIAERRKAVRQPINRKVALVTLGGRVEATARNVSLTGVCVEQVTGLTPKSKVQVDLGQGLVRAVVIWVNGAKAGLAFEVPLTALPPSEPVVRMAA